MRQSVDWRLVPLTKAAGLVVAIALGLIVIISLWAGLNWLRDDESPSPYSKEVQLTDRNNEAVVKLARGGELLIALASNPSTGFGWHANEGAGPGLELIDGPRYVPPGSTSPVLGASGTEVFTFRAVEAGSITVTLEYRRSFEPGVVPERIFRITADIR